MALAPQRAGQRSALDRRPVDDGERHVDQRHRRRRGRRADRVGRGLVHDVSSDCRSVEGRAASGSGAHAGPDFRQMTSPRNKDEIELLVEILMERAAASAAPGRS
jgi:hypothetical protein